MSEAIKENEQAVEHRNGDSDGPSNYARPVNRLSQKVWTAMRWDAVAVEERAELFVENLREPVLWLMTYTRDHCSKNVDVLAARAAKLGIELDTTTWSRVLRGRWNRDGEGRPLTSPIVAEKKLLRAIEALREDARLGEVRGRVPFIETEIARSINCFLDDRRVPDRLNKFGVIVGETGTGKTAVYKEYVRRSPTNLVAWVEAPENGSLLELNSQIARRFGVNLDNLSVRMRVRLLEVINDRRCIIVDNAQDLLHHRRGQTQQQQPAFSWLRRLQDETGCTIILSLTPSGEKQLFEAFLRGYFEQFEGRAGGRRSFLRLPAYPPEEDVLALAKGVGVRDVERHQDYLVKLSRERGRLRAMFEVLQEAKVRAEEEKKPLTIGLIKAVRGED